MSGLIPIESSNLQHQHILSEEGLITQKLPSELLEKVLSFLDALGIQKASIVNKLWNQTAIRAAKHREFSLLKNLVNFLAKKIFSDQSPELDDVMRDKSILQSITLIQIKDTIIAKKEKILNILCELKGKDLKKLEIDWKEQSLTNDSHKEPVFFERIFETAKINKEIGKAKLIPDEIKRSSTLGEISKALAKTGRIEKAIEAAYSIQDFFLKQYALVYIAIALAKNDSIKQAFKLVSEFNMLERDNALRDIAKALAKQGNIDKAREVANTISDVEDREYVLTTIGKLSSKRLKYS